MQSDPLEGYPPMMRPEQVAEFLTVTVSRLAQWRSEGGGPPYAKLTPGRNGTVRYPREDLRKFVSERMNTKAEVS